MINQGADNAGGIFIFAIIFLALGIWMVTSNKPNKAVHDDENNSQNNSKDIGKSISDEIIALSEAKVAFRKDIERVFNESITDTINQTGGYDNAMIGISVQTAIKSTSKALKISDFTATGLTKQETDMIIDEISEAMLDGCKHKQTYG